MSEYLSWVSSSTGAPPRSSPSPKPADLSGPARPTTPGGSPFLPPTGPPPPFPGPPAPAYGFPDPARPISGQEFFAFYRNKAEHSAALPASMESKPVLDKILDDAKSASAPYPPAYSRGTKLFPVSEDRRGHFLYRYPGPNDESLEYSKLKLDNVVKYKSPTKPPVDARLKKLIAANQSFLFYALDNQGYIRILSHNGTQRGLFQEHSSFVTRISICPTDSSLVASVDESGVLYIWRLTPGTEIKYSVLWSSADEEADAVPYFNAKWHPEDRNYIALQCAETIQIWNFDTTTPDETSTDSMIHSLGPHSSKIQQFSFSQSGSLIAVGCEDGYVRLWDTSAGHFVAEYEHLSLSPVVNLGWLGGDQYVIAFSESSPLLTICDVKSRAVISRLEIAQPPADSELGFSRFGVSQLSISSSGDFAFLAYFSPEPLNVTGDHGLLVIHAGPQRAFETFSFQFVTPFASGNRIYDFDVLESLDTLEFFFMQSQGIMKSSLHKEECLPREDPRIDGFPVDPYGRPMVPFDGRPMVPYDGPEVRSPEIAPFQPASLFSGALLNPSSFGESPSAKAAAEAQAAEAVKILPRASSSRSETPVSAPTPAPVSEGDSEKTAEPSKSEEAKSKSKVAETNLVAKLDKLFERHHQKMLKSFEKERAEYEASERARTQRLLDAIAKTIHSVIPLQLNTVVKTHMETLVIPSISREIDRHIDEINAKAFASIDAKVKSAVTDAVRESITGPAMEETLKEPLAMAFKSSFQKLLIPAFQAGFSNIFEQVNAHLQKYLKDREGKLDSLLTEQKSVLSKVQSGIDAMPKIIADSVAHLPKDYESKSPLPKAPVVKDPMELVKALLAEEKLNDAFAEVLNLSRPDLVVELCSMTDERMWSVLPVLSGAVTLALVQQISFDLHAETHLKLSWLLGALVMLFRKVDDSIARHVPGILKQVLANLESQTPELEGKFGRELTNLKMMISNQLMAGGR